MTKQSSGETRREAAKLRLHSKCELEKCRCRLILRHCERSEAIQSLTAEGYWICFALLAMTALRERAPHSALVSVLRSNPRALQRAQDT
jgi:hypothetical protein